LSHAKSTNFCQYREQRKGKNQIQGKGEEKYGKFEVGGGVGYSEKYILNTKFTQGGREKGPKCWVKKELN